MPVFISHSHQDKYFVDTLVGQLEMRKTEVKVRNSLTGQVQAGIKSASALLIILSKASVAW